MWKLGMGGAGREEGRREKMVRGLEVMGVSRLEGRWQTSKNECVCGGRGVAGRYEMLKKSWENMGSVHEWKRR